MASAASGARLNANTGSKRMLPWAKDSAREGPAPKRARKEAKLDELKTQRRKETELLKEGIELELEFVKGKDIADELGLRLFSVVCNEILSGEADDEHVLKLFKTSIATMFKGEDLLREKLGSQRIEQHQLNLADINQLIAGIIKLTEDILDELNSPTRGEDAAAASEDIQISPLASDDNIMKRRLVVDDSAARILRPSDLSQPKYYLQLKESRFALHRPPNHTTLPLALLHPIFAEFVADVEHHKPTPEDNALVQELSGVMSEPWEDKMAQSEKFRQILAKHYHIQLYSARVASTDRISDGHAVLGKYIYVVLGMKGWNGKGDLEVQASLYSLEAFRPILLGGKDPLDLLPCIIVYCIGNLIGFSGTVITDRFQLESLTQCFTLPTNVHENAMATRLARAFGAFRLAVEKLCTHYQNLNSSKLHDLQTRERALRVIFPYPDSYETEDGKIKFTYDSRFNDGKLMFLATTARGIKVLVKFTRRYSKEAHQLCAKAGVAPSLLGFQSLQAGWYMAVMEYLDPQTYRVLGPEDGSNHASLIAEIRHVVQVLHNGGFVHGDIRDVNMMTRRQWRTDAQNVFLLDFDWAGRKDATIYPPNLNRETVKRHEGAKDGAVITQEHDWAMVDCIFDPTGRLYL